MLEVAVRTQKPPPREELTRTSENARARLARLRAGAEEGFGCA